MTEKELIQRETAEHFLRLYNRKLGTDYAIRECSDAPDVRCADSKGRPLFLEVTLTEGRPADIQSLLGRSDARSSEVLRSELDSVRARETSILERVTSSDAAMANATARIREKTKNRYGANTALVVRDTSGGLWDWDLLVEEIRNTLANVTNPFDRGIWILSANLEGLLQVL